MGTYLIFSRLSPEAVKDPAEFKHLAGTVSGMLKSKCPNVNWKDSYAVLGRFDIVDVVEAENAKDVERAAMIIRAYGHATTETLQATPWKEFLESL